MLYSAKLLSLPPRTPTPPSATGRLERHVAAGDCGEVRGREPPRSQFRMRARGWAPSDLLLHEFHSLYRRNFRFHRRCLRSLRIFPCRRGLEATEPHCISQPVIFTIVVVLETICDLEQFSLQFPHLLSA